VPLARAGSVGWGHRTATSRRGFRHGFVSIAAFVAAAVVLADAFTRAS